MVIQRFRIEVATRGRILENLSLAISSVTSPQLHKASISQIQDRTHTPPRTLLICFPHRAGRAGPHKGWRAQLANFPAGGAGCPVYLAKTLTAQRSNWFRGGIIELVTLDWWKRSRIFQHSALSERIQTKSILQIPHSSSCNIPYLMVIFIGPKSNHNLALSVTQYSFCSTCWICQSCYMDFSKLLHGFVKIDTWFHFGNVASHFFKVDTWICQSCSIYFLPFAKQNQAEV